MKSTILTRIFMIVLLAASGCAGIKIVDNPITYDETRRQLSLEYLQQRHGLQAAEPTIEPRMIVVHWTGSGTFDELFRTFDPPRLAGRPEITGASPLNVSSQFGIDRDGTIYSFMPDNYFARHVIGLNYTAIGIENVGDGEQYPLTEAQLKANEKLIRYLVSKYPDIEYVIGHYEYNRFRNHPLWKETSDTYRTEKTDPGIDFMNKLRRRISDLNLKRVP